MPRPKGGSGNRSSSGHSYSTRSSSGHRISGSAQRRPGSSQPGSSFSGQPSGSSYFSQKDRSYRQPGPMPQTGYRRRQSPGFFPGFLMGSMLSGRRRRYDVPDFPPQGYPGGYDQGSRYRSRRGSSLIWILVIVLILIFLFSAMSGCSSSSDEAGNSSYNREKITASQPFDADCIVDEAGFFETPSKTGQRLKTFYDKTGVQPHVVIEDYDPSLKTDAQKEAYAQQYYDEYIGNEDTFLYMYFADADPDSVGYMQTVNGKNTEAVMDPEAVNIFWNYMDSEWTSSKSTDDMFVDVFDKTADRIMTKTATGKDVAMRTLLVGGIVIVAAAIIILVMMKHRREKEKAEETRRILETPLKTDDPDDDDLVHRYGG